MVLKTHYATFLAVASSDFSNFLYTIRRWYRAHFGANCMSKWFVVLDILGKRGQNRGQNWDRKFVVPFLQFRSLHFSDFQQGVRAQHWVHLRRICISKDFRFLTFWSKRAKNWRFWIFLKIRFLVLCKETLFFFYTCRWVLCPVLNFFHLQDWSYSLWLV